MKKEENLEVKLKKRKLIAAIDTNEKDMYPYIPRSSSKPQEDTLYISEEVGKAGCKIIDFWLGDDKVFSYHTEHTFEPIKEEESEEEKVQRTLKTLYKDLVDDCRGHPTDTIQAAAGILTLIIECLGLF